MFSTSEYNSRLKEISQFYIKRI